MHAQSMPVSCGPPFDYLLSNNNFKVRLLSLNNEFANLESQFASEKRVKFRCSLKLIPPEGKKTVLAYKCYNCGLEDNSIHCMDCFQNQKHKNHQYELLEISGGFCDCGDNSKWEEKSFCSTHTLKQKHKKNINKELQQSFNRVSNDAFQQLCSLYQILKANSLKNVSQKQSIDQSLPEQKIQALKQIVDNYGSSFVNHLIDFNEDRHNVNIICKEWLQSTFTFEKKLRFIRKGPIFQQMMKFFQLQKTSKACVQLYMLIFSNLSFKEAVTVAFFKIYSSIPSYISSGYSDFIPQLFSSSRLIARIANQKLKYKIDPLFCCSLVQDNLKEQALQANIIKIGAQYKSYYNDLHYLFKIKKDCRQIYWTWFFQFCTENNFSKFISYLDTLTEKNQYLSLTNKFIYEIEEYAMQTCLKIIERVPNITFVQKSLKKQYTRVFIDKQTDYLSQGQNLFFTDYRLLSIFMFCYIHGNFVGEQQIYNLNYVNSNHISSLCELLDISQQKFEEDMLQLIYTISQYFYKISKADLLQNNSFLKTYFLSDNTNLLPSLDAFLLKFALITFSIPREGKSLQDSQLFQKKLNKKIDDQLSTFVPKQQSQKQLSFEQMSKNITAFHSFTNLLLESRLSDLSQLVLLNKVKPLLQFQIYKKRYLSFYEKILKLMIPQGQKRNLVSVNKMRKLIRFIFFKNEESVFQQFVNFYKAENRDYLLAKTVIREEVNLDYFYSLRFKLDNVNNIILNAHFGYNPYGYYSKACSLFSDDSYLQTVKQFLQWFKKCSFHNQKPYSQLLNQCVSQLWKVRNLSKSKTIFDYFQKDFPSQKCNRQQQSVFLSISVDLHDQIQEQIKKKIDQQFSSGYSEAYKFNKDNLENGDPSEPIRNEQRRQHRHQTSKIQQYLVIQERCLFGQQCLLNNLRSKLDQLCFLKTTNMYSPFGISSKEKILVFSTCGHFAHRRCIEENVKEQQSIQRCPQCGKIFNISLLIDREFFQQNAENSAENQISALIQKQSSFYYKQQLPVANRSIKRQIFVSIAAFLLSTTQVDDLSLLKTNILLYKKLFEQLSLRSLRSVHFNFLSIKSTLKLNNSQKLNKETQKLLIWIFVSVFKSLKSKQQPYEQVDKEKEQQFQEKYPSVNQILKIFKMNSSTPSIQPFNQTTKQPILQKAKQILPTKLAQFSTNMKCNLCQKQHQISYFVCLLPHYHEKDNKQDKKAQVIQQQQQQQYCFCRGCLNTNNTLVSHIRSYHLNEAFFIESSTGQPYYYYALNGSDKWLMFEGESLYRNSISKSFQKGKKDDKSKFQLSEQKLRTIINKFNSWTLPSLSKLICI